MQISLKLIKEIFLYGIIGGISAGLDSIAFASIAKLGVNIYIANFISINLGIITSFMLNTYLNFRVKDNIKRRMMSFFGVGYIGMVISTLILYVGNDIWGLHIMFVKITSVVIVAAVQFILNKFITYKRSEK